MADRDTPTLQPPVSSNDHIRGPRRAPVHLVEYADFECPYCAQARGVVEQLLDNLPDFVTHVFRHFPLSQIHPSARLAAEAAEAAAAQGRFWQMHDTLYDNQDALDAQSLIGYADDIGLNTDRFVRDLETGAFTERVRRDFLSGVRSGVNGTPTFFINGRRHDGPWDLASLTSAIEYREPVYR